MKPWKIHWLAQVAKHNVNMRELSHITGIKYDYLRKIKCDLSTGNNLREKIMWGTNRIIKQKESEEDK